MMKHIKHSGKVPVLALTAAMLLAASPVFAADTTPKPSPSPSGVPSADVPPPPEGGPGGPPPEGKGPDDHFMRGDTNKDGFLSKEEMMAEHQKRFDKMFEEADTNHDGKLSPEEMKAGREKMREKMKERMREHGPDHDGPDGKADDDKKDGDKGGFLKNLLGKMKDDDTKKQ